MSNTITAYFKGRIGVAESVYQNDYGMVMNFDSIDLPAHFDCYFSILNQEEAIPGVGADGMVAIPNSVLANPGTVTIHIPLHTGANDSEVEYIVYFKVIGRARPIDDGTPTQMTAIEQALALLQNPITNIEQIVNEALAFTGKTLDDLQDEINDVELDFAVLQAQYDTAVAALTVDSEVADIRVGDDGITDASAGASVRRQFSDLKNKINERARIPYHNSPMYLIDEPENESMNTYKADGTTASVVTGTRILKAPNYLAFRCIGSTARLILYVGDMVGGAFVPDLDDYLFYTTSLDDTANYMGEGFNQIIETRGKYICYSKYVDASNIEIVGMDELPSNADKSIYTHSTYFSTLNGDLDEGNAKYNGFIIPKGCSYFIDAPIETYNTVRLSVPLLDPDTIGFTNIAERSIFGYVPDNYPFGLISFGDSTATSIDFSNVNLYVYGDSKRPQGYSRAMFDIMDSIRNISWLCKKKTKWSEYDSVYFNVGQYYCAIPYSSRWKNPHFVGWEVSLETAYNAANDEYSIWYDDTVGRSELGERGGTGYGLVCSSYVSMLMGAKSPQTNFGFTHDNRFQVEADSAIRVGECYTDIANHAFGVNAILDHGAVTSELSQYTTVNNVRTSSDKIARTLKNITKVELLQELGFHYRVSYKGIQKKPDEYLLNTSFALANGSVRPWRGNKSVYGLWDKSADGSGIGITIHDGATTAYMITPSNVTKTYDVTGLTYLDVSADVTESGTYELYSNVSNTKEYFKFYDTGAVTLLIDENGKASFDNPDVLYCYAGASGGYGKEFGELFEIDGGAITFANGSYYPEMVNREINVFSAIIADPDDDCWGCYGTVCNYEGNNSDIDNDDNETPNS